MKALILTTHTGGGHDACASAISEALQKQGMECVIKDCVEFGGKRLSKAVSSAYITVAKRWSTKFGKVYRFAKSISTTKIDSPVYLFNIIYAKKMGDFIEEYQPDVVVSTHLFAGQTLTHLRKHGRLKPYFVMIMTDYTMIPFSEDIRADLLATHPFVLPEIAKRHYLDKEVAAYGIPVSKDCRPCPDKDQAKRELGIDPAKTEILLAGGSMGAGNLPETVEHLLETMDESMHMTVVCGTNRQVREQLEEKFSGSTAVSILGVVRPLTRWIKACDLLISKTGGLTSTEAMTIGVPFIGFNPIQGCETANAGHFAEHGMIIYAHDFKELDAAVDKLTHDKTAAEEMLACQRKYIDPDAAEKLAQRIIREAEQQER